MFQASNYNQSIQHATKLEDFPRYILRAALDGGSAGTSEKPTPAG